ncbi:hypothetical protein BDA99DRAFT_108653 [Phascolomyces articulosus]|uniref:Helitron helicase-like domain-containing protein n=1 Tax=Phascolomyces articulosus TaxID=60185 RepID=A0AAD5PCI7_9FUNG|nr:hypothetical protein BDA99DRAFT_108653 [Phascolomyces articulosus]
MLLMLCESIRQLQVPSCRCGSTTHRRVTFRGCPLNERNVRRRIEPENPSLGGDNVNIIIENPAPQQLIPTEVIDVVSDEDTVAIKDGVPTNTNTNNDTTVRTRVCPRCGSPEHFHSNNRACPFNRNNESEYGPQFKIACTVSFVPGHISETYGDRPFGSVNVVIRAAREMRRRYDQQSYPEVAAMVVESMIDGSTTPHDIVINGRTSGIREISSLRPSYMLLHYVLMFPFGENGWFNGMRCVSTDNQSSNVILLDFCAYMLMIRGDDNIFHHHFGRLFQQLVVDNYARIEVHVCATLQHTNRSSVQNCIVVLVML